MPICCTPTKKCKLLIIIIFSEPSLQTHHQHSYAFIICNYAAKIKKRYAVLKHTSIKVEMKLYLSSLCQFRQLLQNRIYEGENNLLFSKMELLDNLIFCAFFFCETIQRV